MRDTKKSEKCFSSSLRTVSLQQFDVGEEILMSPFLSLDSQLSTAALRSTMLRGMMMWFIYSDV